MEGPLDILIPEHLKMLLKFLVDGGTKSKRIKYIIIMLLLKTIEHKVNFR
jgi:hypothetical protein